MRLTLVGSLETAAASIPLYCAPSIVSKLARNKDRPALKPKLRNPNDQNLPKLPLELWHYEADRPDRNIKLTVHKPDGSGPARGDEVTFNPADRTFAHGSHYGIKEPESGAYAHADYACLVALDLIQQRVPGFENLVVWKQEALDAGRKPSARAHAPARPKSYAEVGEPIPAKTTRQTGREREIEEEGRRSRSREPRWRVQSIQGGVTAEAYVLLTPEEFSCVDRTVARFSGPAAHQPHPIEVNDDELVNVLQAHALETIRPESLLMEATHGAWSNAANARALLEHLWRLVQRINAGRVDGVALRIEDVLAPAEVGETDRGPIFAKRRFYRILPAQEETPPPVLRRKERAAK